jgi:hypothetical protein
MFLFLQIASLLLSYIQTFVLTLLLSHPRLLLLLLLALIQLLVLSPFFLQQLSLLPELLPAVYPTSNSAANNRWTCLLIRNEFEADRRDF